MRIHNNVWVARDLCCWPEFNLLEGFTALKVISDRLCEIQNPSAQLTENSQMLLLPVTMTGVQGLCWFSCLYLWSALHFHPLIHFFLHKTNYLYLNANRHSKNLILFIWAKKPPHLPFSVILFFYLYKTNRAVLGF